MKCSWNPLRQSRFFGPKLVMAFASILFWGSQPGCASNNQTDARLDVQEPVANVGAPRSAVVTRLSLEPAATIALRALRLRAEETGHKILCSSAEVLKFSVQSNYEAYVAASGGIYVVSEGRISTLKDKDGLETKLEEVLSLISDTRADFLRPGPDRAEPSQPFTRSLYYTPVYYVETGAPFYHAVLLAPIGAGLTLNLTNRPIEARAMAVSGRSWTGSRVAIRGVKYLAFPFRPPYQTGEGYIATLNLAAGDHSLDWRYSHGVCRLEFLTRDSGGVDLAGVGASDCTYVRTQPISQLQLPDCLQITP